MKTRVIARHQQIVRIDHERREPVARSTRRKTFSALALRAKKLDGLVLSDYDKGLITDAFADRVLSACHQLKVPVFVKPKTSRLYAYRGARVIVCNAKEAGFFVTRSLHDEKSFEEAGPRTARAFRLQRRGHHSRRKGHERFRRILAATYYDSGNKFRSNIRSCRTVWRGARRHRSSGIRRYRCGRHRAQRASPWRSQPARHRCAAMSPRSWPNTRALALSFGQTRHRQRSTVTRTFCRFGRLVDDSPPQLRIKTMAGN